MKNFHEFNSSVPSEASRMRGRNRFRKGFIISILTILIIALCIGLAFTVFKKSDADVIVKKGFKGNKTYAICRDIPNEEKFDCYPDTPVTEFKCLERGCCYSIPKNVNNQSSFPPLNVPYCFYPPDYAGYVVEDVINTTRRILIKLKKNTSSGFRNDITNVNMLISFHDDYNLRIKITDADSPRYEVPITLQYQTGELKNRLYDVTFDSKAGLLVILRKSTGTAIFQINVAHLVYSDQFLQLSSYLPSSTIYGIGEHYGGILRNVNWTRFTLINSDLAPKADHGLYGSHPFYMMLEKNGIASGVFLFNSNVMDIVLQPTPAITFRPIGGILDFFIMLGPSPKDVTQQYSNIVGKTFMPPFWSLGFHLCRYGYNSLNTTKETMERTINAQIPLDVQWNDIDYMDQYKDFTYDKVNFAGLPEYIDDLHSKGMHYVLITDPGISNSEKVYPPYDEGIEDDIFVKTANGSHLIGKVWTNGTTVYPDFSHPASTSFWTRQFKRLYDEIKFDGVWIDMNEPSNFLNGDVDGCPKSTFETPQYIPGDNLLITKTLCMTAKHYYTIHYNEHNIYAFREAVATNKVLKSIRKGRRPFIISRASFSGQGVYSGHWSGDIFSTWEDMRYSIPSLINFNMYAIPMIGSDICGFNGNTTIELCARWHALGAFYPFSRNHNGKDTIEQDPVALGPTVIEAAVISMQKRYTLLPYLYTLFYRSHVFGDTVIRPLFFEFPQDENTYSIDEQFFWGSGIMIVPVLYPNTSTITTYFPKGVWYDALTAQPRKSSGEKVSLTVPLTQIYLSIRGGIILPSQIPAQTTQAMRKNPFTLIMALNEDQKANGELYWDDGDSLDTYENGFYNLIKFQANEGYLNSTIVASGYKEEMYLQSINIGGLDVIPTEVTVNGEMCTATTLSISINSMYSKENKDLNSKDIGIFGINIVNDSKLENDTSCQFFKIESIFIIKIKPVSLLSPLSVTWK